MRYDIAVADVLMSSKAARAASIAAREAKGLPPAVAALKAMAEASGKPTRVVHGIVWRMKLKLQSGEYQTHTKPTLAFKADIYDGVIVLHTYKDKTYYAPRSIEIQARDGRWISGKDWVEFMESNNGEK